MTTSQATKNKRRGASWEIALRDWFRERGLNAERLRLNGALDEGDLIVNDDGILTLIEAKDAQQFDLSGWLKEVEVERVNYAGARGVASDDVWPIVVIKRRGQPIENAYVVTTLGEFFK